MKNFKTFIKRITDNPTQETEFSINGEIKRIRGMAQFKTKNYPEYEYIKIIFQDHSFMLIMIDDEDLFYSDEVVGQIEEISDDEIGNENLEYNGKKYRLVNKDDYQFCVRLYVGMPPEDIEGEAHFSDYFPVKGEKEFLSLGWLSYNGERADLNPKIIDLSQIEFPS